MRNVMFKYATLIFELKETAAIAYKEKILHLSHTSDYTIYYQH